MQSHTAIEQCSPTLLVSCADPHCQRAVQPHKASEQCSPTLPFNRPVPHCHSTVQSHTAIQQCSPTLPFNSAVPHCHSTVQSHTAIQQWVPQCHSTVQSHTNSSASPTRDRIWLDQQRSASSKAKPCTPDNGVRLSVPYYANRNSVDKTGQAWRGNRQFPFSKFS